jgi:hypothetical protein
VDVAETDAGEGRKYEVHRLDIDCIVVQLFAHAQESHLWLSPYLFVDLSVDQEEKGEEEAHHDQHDDQTDRPQSQLDLLQEDNVVMIVVLVVAEIWVLDDLVPLLLIKLLYLM